MKTSGYLCIVKAVVAIFFATLFFVGSLLPRSNFRELEKIPSMIMHFQHHKSITSSDFTFIQFLVLHFSLSSDHDEPSHQTELPLHSGITASFLFTLPEQLRINTAFVESAVVQTKPFSSNYQFQYTSTWFQPPQLA